MKPYLDVLGTTRAEAAADYRTLPLKQRRDAEATHDGIQYQDVHRVPHTMAWAVVAEQPRRRVA